MIKRTSLIILLLLLCSFASEKSILRDSIFEQIEKSDLNNQRIDLKMEYYLLQNSRNLELRKITLNEIYVESKKLNYKRGLAFFYQKNGLFKRPLSEMDSSIYFINKAIKSYEDLNDIENVIDSYIRKAESYSMYVMLDSSIITLKIAYELSEEAQLHKDLQKICLKIAKNYFDMSDYPNSLKYYSKAIELDEKYLNGKVKANPLSNIGLIYLAQNENELALSYFKRSLMIFKQRNSLSGITWSLVNIGRSYFRNGDYKNALDYFSKALVIYEETSQNKRHSALTLKRIADVYSNLNEFDKALSHYKKSYNYYKYHNRTKSMAMVTGNIGSNFLKEYEYESLKNKNEDLSFNLKYEKLDNSIEFLQKSLNDMKDSKQLNLKTNNLFDLSKAYSLKMIIKTHIDLGVIIIYYMIRCLMGKTD